MYELMARGHVVALTAGAARQRGQGTVEYVGLILLVAVILAGVVKASSGFSDDGVAKAVVGKLKEAIADVGGGK
jgi:hypothetical protein